MLDVLSYMLPARWFAEERHLSASDHPIYGLKKDDWLWMIKGRSGFPWDANYYDDHIVFHSITEGPKGWEDPTSYKIFRSKTWNSRGGIAWCPRFIDPARNYEPLVTDDTTYETYENGRLVNTQTLGGPCVCTVQGPFNLKFGKLDLQSVIVQSYKWDADLKHMEVNYYGLNLGWIKWELHELRNGNYVQVQESLFDRVDHGGTPELIFPSELPK
jgi:hypothetical protein